MNGIKVNQLRKAFGGTVALDDISFEVAPGERFGLIGPDGAGKSTLFKILTTLLIPDGGAAQVAGLDINQDYQAIRRSVGYMPGKFSLYTDLSVEENLEFFAAIFGTTVRKNYHLIKDIYEQIEPFRKRRAGALSGGMKQKLALCCALIHQPKVLFLDEPTTGVDAVSRDEFWEMLGRLKNEGITILVSTPYMDEAARCERVALIQAGNILSLDTPEAVVAAYPHELWRIKSAAYYRLLQDLRTADFTQRVEVFGEYLHLTTRPGTIQETIYQFALDKGHTDLTVNRTAPTIEDVFLDLM